VNLYEKLIEIRKEVPYLQKENAGAQYKYVSSSQVLSNCKKKMDELKILLVPRVTGHKVLESPIEQRDKDGNVFKRTTTYFTELDMEMTWVNAEKPDEMIVCSWYGQGVDIAGEKGVGKAMTYAEKYFMLKFFNIPTDKDDPDLFQDKLEGKEPPKPTQPVAPLVRVVPPIKVTTPAQPDSTLKANAAMKAEKTALLNQAITDSLLSPAPKAETPAAKPKPINFPAFWAECKKIGYTESDVHEYTKCDSLKDWTREQLASLTAELKGIKANEMEGK